LKKTSTLFLLIIFAILCYFTVDSYMKFYDSDLERPLASISLDIDKTRIILITQDIDTPFWNKVAEGAKQQAEMENIRLEVWGSYNNNITDFLRKLDIAIYSKVDGIIVQGLDTQEFKTLIKTKASSYGIPVITIAKDVPMEESLRRTYVGSNHYEAGKLIAQQLVQDLGDVGTVVIIYDGQIEHYQLERMKAIEDVLGNYPDINFQRISTEESLEQVMTATQDMLNHYPDLDALIVVDSNILGTVIQEVKRRYKIEPLLIYSFEDDYELSSYLAENQLDGYIEQSPEVMGSLSVKQMMEWLNGKAVPLKKEGYFTDIKLVKAKDLP